MNESQSLNSALGFHHHTPATYAEARRRMCRYINLILKSLGLPAPTAMMDEPFHDTVKSMLASYHAKSVLLADHRCPVDQRIESFLNNHFADMNLESPLCLPDRTLILDQHGMAREMSVPVSEDVFKSDLVESHRVANGILNNPRHDRRTTKGTFHVVEGGLPVPFGKMSVPRIAFLRMFRAALNAPADLMQLPFTSGEDVEPARTFVSLHMHPIVCPEVQGFTKEKRYEVRFFVPGSLVSNLDFVESIFGNAGDPFLEDNDLAKYAEHWTGTTGCVILAPHLEKMTKKELGLPHINEATDRQKAEGMCWSDPGELYNDGSAFKVTCRTDEGVIVTLIADNYYGYCKKEVKTQISYSANLYGNAEEEHAGGALVFPSYNLGEEYTTGRHTAETRTIDQVFEMYGTLMDVKPEGYGVDKAFPDLIYIPQLAKASLPDQSVSWTYKGQAHSLTMMPGKVYMSPSGYKIRMEKHPESPVWRLIGTVSEGTFCHKPCTVSGGGKSEISKSLQDFMIYGPIFVADVDSDMKKIQEIFDRDYTTRWRPDRDPPPDYTTRAPRSALHPDRSLGSLIKLLTPSRDYNDEFNTWLESIPNYIYAMVYVIKRFHREEWGNTGWREHFTVDNVNGFPGHELKYNERKLVGSYLRVGFEEGSIWRTFKLRQDFLPSVKIQTEDDITASTVVPTHKLNYLFDMKYGHSVKFIQNCEYRLFQRPDEAIHRGFDVQAEGDLAKPYNFLCNFQPMTRPEIQEMVSRVADFDHFTNPMHDLLSNFAKGEGKPEFTVSSSNPRLVNGKPTKNPRYLQDRPDMVAPFPKYVADRGTRLSRMVPLDEPVLHPVHAVVIGRRNNPPDHKAGIRALAVYSPIHYQPIPEFFMDVIASLTGKSPSTTGTGSEGALTKGPFNALRPTADLNAALVSMILTNVPGFSSAAGFIGPNIQVDHDISLLIPEIWARLYPHEREPDYLIGEGLLEKLDDYAYKGKTILASRLGYRITKKFVRRFFGRVFDNPDKVFTDDILRPETQNADDFAEGVKNITEVQQRVARAYFEDGTVEEACPPLQVLLHIMAHGHWEGKDAHSPDVRAMFDLDAMLQSDWYRKRLQTKHDREIALLTRLGASTRNVPMVDELVGTSGADPLG